MTLLVQKRRQLYFSNQFQPTESLLMNNPLKITYRFILIDSLNHFFFLNLFKELPYILNGLIFVIDESY